MSKEIDRTEALRREIIGAIVEGSGMREILAVPLADSVLTYLQREYPGQKIYIPAPARQYDLLQITAALKRGESPASVCRTHNMSRSTLYKMFPGGLPKPAESAA